MTKKIRPELTLDVCGINKHGNCKAVICSDNGKRWASALDCAEDLGVCISSVSSCCLGKTRTCNGLHLHYAYDDITDTLCNRIQEQANVLDTKDSTIAYQQAELNDLRTKTNNTHNSLKAAMEYRNNAKKAWEDAMLATEKAKAAEDRAEAEYKQAMAQFDGLLGKLFEERG